MPRKHRDIRTAMTSKGFVIDNQRHHVFLAYRREDGILTNFRTKLSHSSAGSDVSDNLLGQMAKQVGLARPDFLRLVDCPMTRAEYEQTAKA